MVKKLHSAKVISIIISVGLVVFLLSKIKYDDVLTTLYEIDPFFLIIGFIVYLFSYVVRSVRFQIMLGNEIRFSKMFTIICVNSLLNKILPARTGEISYIYLLQKTCNRKTGEGVATLFVSRILDFFVIVLFLLISLVSIHSITNQFGQVMWFTVGCGLIVILLMSAFIWYNHQFLELMVKFTQKIKIAKYGNVQYVIRKITETVDSVQAIKSGNIILKTLILSVVIWSLMFLFYGVLLAAFGINLGLPETIMIVSCTALLPLLPFYSIGGFGTTEFTTTALLIAVGIPTEKAIVVSFGTHLIGVVYCIIAGFYGLAKLKWEKT